MQIELSEQEVQALLEVLMSSTGMPWKITHPLIVKIGTQHQQAIEAAQRLQMKGNSHSDRANRDFGSGDLDQERRAAGGLAGLGSAGRDSTAH